MPQENSKTLSIVIPVFNEVNFLYELFDQIKKYFNNNNTEIIVVDDGSTDGSLNLLEELKNKNNYKIYDIIKKIDKYSQKKIKIKWLSNKIIKEKIYKFKTLNGWKPKNSDIKDIIRIITE